MTIIAAYDVHDNDRRARLAALLQAYGDRVQKSVFVLEVTPDELRQVCERGADIIQTDRDSFWLTPCCADCWGKVIRVGQVGLPERVLYWAVL